MTSITLLGLVGGTLTTASFLPQVVRTWKTRSTKDISLGMFSLLCGGIFIWIIYGFLIGSLPVVLSNLISLALTVIILAFKIRYK